jgi:hypothetical protein
VKEPVRNEPHYLKESLNIVKNFFKLFSSQ